jgi:N-acetyl-gamma-glutamylphosphate reductase
VLFGVSGYSGAGRTPSPRNDPDTLRDNLMPYSLVGHMHEREVSFQLGREVRFTPHVAAFFRGISMTIAVTLVKEVNEADILATFESHYRGEPRVHVTADVPQVRQAIESPDAWIGGFSVDARDPRRLTMVSVLDNLSKGAASQALQNLNLALGLDEQAGVEHV